MIEEVTVLPSWTKSQVRGRMGAITPNASAEVNFRFRVGYAQHMDYSMIRCSYDNSTCYKAKAVAKIDSISAVEGYITGGQLLTVRGHGFNSDNIDVQIDGVTCTVTETGSEYFKCLTGGNSAPSTQANYVGEHGLRRKFLNVTYPLTASNINAETNFVEILALDLENPVNIKDGYSGNIYSGYFKAPATAKYRFFISCDDWCRFNFSSASMDPSQAETIYTSNGWTQYRNYILGSRKTDWLSLTAGEFYYITVEHIQGNGGDHLTVSLEIEDSALPDGHFQTQREVQLLQITQELTREMTNITITDPDGGEFTLGFMDPKAFTMTTSAKLNTNMNAGEFSDGVREFYDKVHSAWITVQKTMYLADGTITTQVLEAKKVIFTIQVQRSLSIPSTNKIKVSRISTSSVIDVTLPADTQISNLPLSGMYRIKCQLLDGTWNQTLEMQTSNSWPSTIRDRLVQACPQYRDKIEVTAGPDQGYYEDNRDIMIRFVGFSSDIAQLEIISSDNVPLVGANVTTNSTTFVDYNPKVLFYEPVPFEFLHTAESKPQVLVKVDGIEAVCHGLACGYNYITPTAQITSFSFSGNTLTVNGINLPAQIQSIQFSHVDCDTINRVSLTQLTCHVVPVAGTWFPIVTEEKGIIPMAPGLSPIEIALSLSSILPNVNINPYGGTILTISGLNLPQSQTLDSFSVTFAGSNKCSPVSLSSTTLRCITEVFPSSPSGTISVTVEVNGKTDNTLTVTKRSDPTSFVSVTPSSVSPVLKSVLTLVVQDYSYTLDKTDLEVWIQSKTKPEKIYRINVMEVGPVSGNANQQYLKVKFGGADSDTYSVFVRSRSYGSFDASALTFVTMGKVTGFSPKSGSIHGGSLITIDGINFSQDNIQDNPVSIGQTDCMLESTTATQIQCRLMARSGDNEVGTDDLIVFLKTYEEAVCDVPDGCTFTWVDPAKITGYTTAYDTELNDFVLTLTGTGFAASDLPVPSTSNTLLTVDDLDQETISVSDTEIKVRLTDLLGSTSLNIDVYLPVGHPDDSSSNLRSSGLALTPRLNSVSSASGGSYGGSLIVAEVKGVGVNTMNVMLVDSTNAPVCSSVKVTAYAQVECLTKEDMVITGLLKLKIGNTITDCQGTQSECSYQTITDYLNVTAVAKTGATTLQFAGINFDTFASSSFKAHAIYAGVEATSVIVNSATDAVATFASGVPLSAAAIRPRLYFKHNTSPVQHWAAQTATLLNAASITAVDTPVSCSFAGGCTLSLTQAGLLSSLKSSAATIRVCGQICKPIVDQSTDSVTKCSLPAMATTFSITKYKIVAESYLMGVPFSSNAALTNTVWDGSHQNGWTSSAANCWLGTAFRAGYFGVLNEVKYFMSRFKKDNFVDKLRFEGSLDGVAWTTIFTVGQEIHEGWNYYNYPAGQELKYRYYRFYGSATGSCIVGEVSLRGYEVIDSTASSYTCTAQLSLTGAASIPLTGDIVYQSTLTPLLKSISPRFGNVVGGQTVTFTGENFSTNIADYSVALDNRACTVTEATATYFKCTTSKRPGLFPTPTTEIKIAKMGSVVTQGLIFRYANYWSEPSTWGGEFAPIDGDMIQIPKGLSLLVDVDSTPILSAVVVEGALIFPPDANPNHMRTFDAHYVMVRGGLFEVGTEQYPYTSKLVITMHSNRSNPELPIFGNKVIAMYNGVLDLHGVPRNPTWTELDVTADVGATEITLLREVDWVVGEKIAIAPTGYFNVEAEERTIKTIDKTNINKPKITFDEPLLYKHYAGIQKFGASDWIEMRAEVALLTRNILYRGDPETSAKNEYGAHIMVHSNGMETLTARIEYMELFNVGQAFQLGRYPIHFHLIGAVHNSYIKGNAIHQSYNRACTIHGVSYLRLIENVAYNVKGHNFFIEDAAETKNYLEKNLAILTKKSWSLLTSDQTPASFWITHPDNIFRGNHAAGADNYGYWFDTKPNPTGPSFDPNICPENSPLGEFTNNVAHSNGRYGLRIFHKLIPRTYPCKPIIKDPKNVADPYWQNPLIPAVFTNFTSFKNQRNGAIALDIGAVRFENFKVADNILAGIEVELSDNVDDGHAMTNGSLVIGHSDNADEITMSVMSHGIIGPRTEGYQIHNSRFYNFDVAGKGAIGTCSHCFSIPTTDSGGRTLTTSKLYFDPLTVTNKIRYQEPRREIIYDIDGTLTGKGPKSYATPYWRHNDQPECSLNLDTYDGLLCDSRVQVRRIVFENFAPQTFAQMDMNVLQFDDSITSKLDLTAESAYIENITNYSVFPFRKMPTNDWGIPIVTGHKYRIHWARGIDFERMQVTQSYQWKPTDKDLYLIHNFTEVRAKVDFITGGDIIQNTTLLTTAAAKRQTGVNVVYNDTDVKEIHYVINGKNSSRQVLLMKGYRCDGPCLPAVAKTNITGPLRLWSDPTTWKSGKLPLEGEIAEVQPGYNVLFDLVESPIYKEVQINGRVTFKQDIPQLHLRAKNIFVRSGELIIGNEEVPFDGEAKITLFGKKVDLEVVFDNNIDAGNKILLNTGLISMVGKERSYRTRLLRTANQNDTQIYVEPGLDWVKDDQISLASTTTSWDELDSAKIVSYDKVTGNVVLDRKLSFYHWGAPTSTANQYSGVDIRCEVMLLSRNIKISGNNIDNWGCQVLTSDFEEANLELRVGSTYMTNVEISNCSQADTFKGALRFDNAKLGESKIKNSSIYHGLGMGVHIEQSNNIVLEGNNVHNFVRYGINFMISNNITIDNNWVHGVYARDVSMSDGQGAIVACAHIDDDKCQGVRVLNNVVSSVASSGLDTFGYSVPGHDCNDYQTIVFRNNVAHSINGYGAIIYKNLESATQGTCIEASYFTAYKCVMIGIVSTQATANIIFSNMILIDNAFSASANVGVDSSDNTAILRNIKFYGETDAHDCQQEGICLTKPSARGCMEKGAIMPSSFSTDNKARIITSGCNFPQYNIRADATLNGKSMYDSLQFINFKSGLTYCGSKQRVFLLNPREPDYIPALKVTNSRFENVGWDAFAYFFPPPDSWANINECGLFPCTGPNNVLIQFEKASFAGSIVPSRAESSFQLISGTIENSGAFPTCKRVDGWNGYYCSNEKFGHLTWESLDEDKMTRLVTPITVTNSVLNSRNVLNTFMDHLWDGFYPSLKRLSRFISLIQGGPGMVYEINYKGTPPKKQKFAYRSDQTSVTVRITYPKAGVYTIRDSAGKEIKANAWDTSIQAPANLKQAYCGENRYVGVVNILEFYLTRGCVIYIEPIDSIQASVRMNWTLSQFFSDGGTTAFADRVAASLGIKPANIKVVAVYQGSVVVDFSVVEDSSKSLSKAGGINKVQDQLVTKLTQKTINLGAPIMNAQVSASKSTVSPPAASQSTQTSVQNTTTWPSTQTTTTTTSPVVIIDQPKKTPTPAPAVKEVIVTNTSTIVMETKGSDSGSSKLVNALIGSLVGVIVICCVAVFFIYKYRINNAKTTIQVEQKGIQALDESSKVDINQKSQNCEDEDDIFEEQYHPRGINIFGAVDGLIHKMNNADDVIIEEDDNEEDQAETENHTNGPTTRSLLHTKSKDMPQEQPLSERKEPPEEKVQSEQNVDLEAQEITVSAELEKVGI